MTPKAKATNLKLGWLLAAALLVAIGCWVSPANASRPRVEAPSARRLPLSFEPNRGQFASAVRYLSRGRGYQLSLGDDGPVFRFAAGTATGRGATLGVRVIGGQPRTPAASERQPGVFNYLVGGDARRFTTGVESYARLEYRQVLPGIDWLFYGHATGELEYDFVVAPGAQVGALRLSFDGARGITIDARGRLRLELGSGDVIEQSPPIAYQIDEQGQRRLVPVRYEMRADATLGFRVGAYDRRRPLVIDPTLTYATYFGGSGFEDGRAVAMDASGNVYLAGSTSLGLFPISSALQPAYGGGSSDAFVCKLNANGSAIVFATFIGGSDADVASGIAVDVAGNAYIVGNTLSADFPTVSPFQAANAGSLDAFMAKLSADGSALSYSSYLGGSGDDFASAVSVTAAGNARVVGSTYSSNFPTALPVQAALGGDSDAFVSFVNAAGSALTFSSYLGGLSTEVGNGVALGAAGATYVVGSSSSNNFPTRAAFQAANSANSFDAFVTKLSDAGALVYSTYLGGSGRDEASSVAVDSSGAALIAGYTQSSDFPGVSSGFQHVRAGSADAFLTKFDPSGTAVTYSTYLGGAGDDRAQAVAVDAKDSIVLGGYTDSTNFPTLLPNQQANAGGKDAFYAKLASTGEPLYSSYLGGSGTDRAFGVACDKSGAIAVVGSSVSTNFPTQAALYPTRIGSQDAFVIKLPAIHPPAVPAGDGLSWAACGALLLAVGLFAMSRRKPLAPHPNTTS